MNQPSPLEAIFFAALERGSPQERAGYLDQACPADPDLRRRVEKMLAAQAQAGSFLEQPAHCPAPTVSEELNPERPGTVIGLYRLLEQIGEGGMGLVFMAEQLQPIRRKVALKVLKPGMDTRQVVARFEAERQALAIMDHPNIARIIDAGTTESSRSRETSDTPGTLTSSATGRPFFVMELVRGVAITDFCDQHRYSTRQRLELFATVCQAVQHAHQKGIIHRDLKPSNVLVTLHDTAAVPKIIDFGIAKALHQPLTDRTLFTHFAQLIGTPLYMSPEQAEMNGLDVDTRSDVYSLGVLLYELLTGTTPFERATLKQAGPDEMRRLIREAEPPRPSQRVSTLSADAGTTVAEPRGVDARRLHDLLRGELDWIVMKALEKDRNRRYESASALAADVQRYLNDEAVEACPPSAGYRLRKYARRNRVALATCSVVAAALLIGTGVSVWQAVEATEARKLADERLKQAEAESARAGAAEKRATTDAAIATAVSEFLQQDLLGQVTSAPDSAYDHLGVAKLTVREALDRAAARIGSRFQDQPLVEAAIRRTIGEAYNGLAENRLAVPHLERAVALQRAELGSEDQETLRSMQSLGHAYQWAGRIPEAIALHANVLASFKNQLGPSHPRTLQSLARVADAYSFAGQWDTTLQLLSDLLEKRRAVLGPAHPETLATLLPLARTYRSMDRIAESMTFHAEALQGLDAMTGPGRGEAIWCMVSYAYVCERANRLKQGEDLLREALRRCEVRPDQRSQISRAVVLGWLARNLLLQEQFVEGERLAREAIEILEHQSPNDPRIHMWRSVLGGTLLGQQKYEEAELLLLQGLEGLRQRESVMPADQWFRLIEAWERVVRFYEVTQQPERAREWRKKLEGASDPKRVPSAPRPVDNLRATAGSLAPLAGSEHRR